MLASTVERPAPTSTIERFQRIMSIPKNTPDSSPARRSRQLRRPWSRSSRSTSRPSTGSAYTQRKIAASDGDAWLSRTRMLENAIVTAPITAKARARSLSLRRGAWSRTAMESGLARSTEPAWPAPGGFACRAGRMSDVTIDSGSESTPVVPRTPPHDAELFRALCERILRQNWREGAMPDGSAVRLHLPRASGTTRGSSTGTRASPRSPGGISTPSARVASSSRCSPPSAPTASSATRSSGTCR